MALLTAGSGLGSYVVAKLRNEYGPATGADSGFQIAAKEKLKNRYYKTWKPTHDPHIVQGGPYLGGGRIANLGSAHVKMYIDAKATMTGDVMTSQEALFLAAAFGAGKPELKQAGTTTAYELWSTPANGSPKAGINLEPPEVHHATKEASFLDMQVGIPYTNAEITPYNYHSGVVTKAEFVFDRVALCAQTLDIDFQRVETETKEAEPEYTTNSVPFAMTEGGSEFKIGHPGSMETLGGVRKMTVTLERAMKFDRIYLGNERKELPISNNMVKVGVSMEADFTEKAKTVFEAFLKNEALEVEAIALGAEIGSSGKKNKFAFKLPNVFINSGGEPPIDGPEIIHNTMSAEALINLSNSPVISAELITADTAL